MPRISKKLTICSRVIPTVLQGVLQVLSDALEQRRSVKVSTKTRLKMK